MKATVAFSLENKKLGARDRHQNIFTRRNFGKIVRNRLQKFLKRRPECKSTISSDRVGLVGARAFPREISVAKLVMCIHAVRGLLGAYGRT